MEGEHAAPVPRPIEVGSMSPRVVVAFLVLVLSVTGVGCPCVRSAVNGSPELRWWLFSNFGASKVCPEMLASGVPLDMPALGSASVGRFFPNGCTVKVDDERKVMTVSLSGTGYVNLPVARRVGFGLTATVEYLPDFRLEEDALYVWGRFGRFVAQPDLRILGAENALVSLATQTPLGNVAQVIGNGIVASEIGKGFTVVRQDDGDAFALGHIEPPAKPRRELPVGKDHVVLASHVTAVRSGARDYLGPFRVEDKEATLFFAARVQEAPVVFTVLERSVGEAWRRSYEQGQPMGPPPGPVVGQGTLSPNASRFPFAVTKGSYYVVVENANANAAPLAPLGVPLPTGETVANVAYNVEVGPR